MILRYTQAVVILNIVLIQLELNNEILSTLFDWLALHS